METHHAIGVFDSGVGGLTVAEALRDLLPNEAIYYFGDTARCPYGNRKPEEVLQFSREICDFLTNKQIKVLVIACNTATATALPILQAECPVPVIGVINPGARAALRATENGRIGVIGTAVTVASNAYANEIHAMNQNVYVRSQACPDFVPLVEMGQFEGEAVESVVYQNLEPLLNDDIDTLILGCTHYPLLAKPIQNVVGEQVKLISSAAETADQVRKFLDERGLRATHDLSSWTKFYTSGDGQQMRQALEEWFSFPGSVLDVDRVSFVESKFQVI